LKMQMRHLSKVLRFGAGAILAAGVAASAAPMAFAVNPAASIPVPAGMTATTEPSCKAHPSAAYCTNSLHFAAALTNAAARGKWTPNLKTAGVRVTSDTCVSRPVQAASFCIIQGVKGASRVTLLFKAGYANAAYAPSAVNTQVNAVLVKAGQDARKATTAAAKTSIIKAANAKVATIKRNAVAYNKAHPKSLVTVTVK